MKIGAELEFFLFKDSYDEAAAEGLPRPHARTRDWIEDYHILQTTRDEYLIRQIRNGMDAAGRAGRVLQGRGRPGPARDQPRLRRGARDGRPPRRSTRTGPRRSPTTNGRSLTFMAKYVDGRGRLVVPHPLERVGRRRATTSLMWDDDGARPPVDGVPAAGSAACVAASRELSLAVRPVRQLLQAVPARLVGADRGRLGRDNRTCGLRVVGHGAGYRVESRIPGADVQPVPRLRRR